MACWRSRLGSNPYSQGLGGPAAPVPVRKASCPPGSVPTPVVTKGRDGKLHTNVVCKPKGLKG